jgi:hypothetical protein
MAVVPMAAASALSALCAAPALADSPSMSLEASGSGSGSAALAALKETARALREAAASAPPGSKRDRTAPYLYSIATIGSVDARVPNQQIQVDLDIHDDMSGVASYFIDYQSPDGRQHVWRLKTVAAPLLHVTPTLTVGALPFSDPGFTVFDAQGTWRADLFYVFDAAGNERTYDVNTLPAYGSTTFFLSNSNNTYDEIAPTLASGTIDTPTIRRSKPPKGAAPGTPPYVSAELSMTDSGNGIISGSALSVLTFCHSSGCNVDKLVLNGSANQTGITANTMSTGTQIREDQTLGQYIMCEIDLIDVADNMSSLKSSFSTCGGSTNFATYFPQGTTIFVNQ